MLIAPCRNAEKGHLNILFWNIPCWGVNNFFSDEIVFCVIPAGLESRQKRRRNGVRCIRLGAIKARFRWRVVCVTGTMCSALPCSLPEGRLPLPPKADVDSPGIRDLISSGIVV